MSISENLAVETSPNAVAAPPVWRNQRTLLQIGLVCLALVLLYYKVAYGLFDQWMRNPDYSHGVFVPFLSAWIVWNKRASLRKLPKAPSNWGLLILFLSLLVLVLGVFGAEVYLARSSMLFVFAGLIVYFFGWKMLRALVFPWAVLFLTIPLPAIIFNQIALPLQFEASRLASGLLGLLGVPVLREGNIIQLSSLTLDVAEACSGLRSLISLVTLAIFYGYLFEPKVIRRVLLVAAAIPIAVVANGFRIMGSGLLGEYWAPDKAEGFFHMFSGFVIFGCSLLLLFGFHMAMTRFRSTTRKEAVA